MRQPLWLPCAIVCGMTSRHGFSCMQATHFRANGVWVGLASVASSHGPRAAHGPADDVQGRRVCVCVCVYVYLFSSVFSAAHELEG